MVGIVVVAHGSLSNELIGTTKMIIGEELAGVVGVAIQDLDQPDGIRQQVEKAIKTVDQGAGVVVFTDMFGGTPSNIALSFLKDQEVEVISGVNLPMLVDMIYSREGKTLVELSSQSAEIGRNSIRRISQYLRNE